MGTSSILGAGRAPTQAAGRDTDALGPSDSSDSGSDIQGEPSLDTRSDREEILSAPHSRHPGDTDAAGTGERGSALPDERVRDGDDISPDRIGRFNGEDSADDLLVDEDDTELTDLDAGDDEFEEDEDFSEERGR
jgi:hypothetical protein